MSRKAGWLPVVFGLGLLVVLGISMFVSMEKVGNSFGQPIAASGAKAVSIADVLRDSAQFEGRMVVVEGRLTSVCPSDGDSVTLTDGSAELFVPLSGFTVPLSPGPRVRVLGVVSVDQGKPNLIGHGLEAL